MEALQSLMHGFSISCEPMNLFYCVAGVVFGVFIGALPGLGPTAGIAILLPVTYGMNPVGGIIMLAGIYYGAMYGGAITSILINTPGDPSSVMTLLDGYPMTKNGKPGEALGIAAISSLISGSLSLLAFTFLAPSLAGFALSFGPPEYFALMFMGLTAIGGMTGKNPFKGYLSALLGLFFGLVGLDLVMGDSRFIFFGFMELYEGIDFIPVAMGLFGIAEIIESAADENPIKISKEEITWRKQLPPKEDMKICMPHMLRSSFLGFLVGLLPGAGATISSFMAYSFAQKVSKRGHLFGTGLPEGVAAPESANSATALGSMIPMLTLGVPGSGATAMMLGALMMFDMNPGPMLFTKDPDFVWGLISSMYIGNFLLLIIAMLCLPMFVRILNVSMPILNAAVMAFILVGAFCLNNSMFDVGLTIFFGVVGYLMKKAKLPASPMVLALILGALLESALRRSLIISGGSAMIFFERPLSCGIMVVGIGTLLWPLLMILKKRLVRRA